MTRSRTTKTTRKLEWTVEPVRIADGRETLVELLFRRIVELEAQLAAQQPERSIR
jgi:hypothetical protein